MENAIEYLCLGSSSSGNCFVLKKHDELVLLECGFTLNEIMNKLLNYGLSISQVKACIITHKHKDHSLALKSLVELGVCCYVPKEMKEEYIRESSVYIVEDKKGYELTSWLKVYAFSVIHDAESYGYAFMDSETKQSTLFINDTKLFDFPLKTTPFDIVFIECNHIRKQLEVCMQQALDKGDVGKVFKYKRQSAYHLSMASCKRLLNMINLSKTKHIFLMHLSRELANDVLCKTEINKCYNIPTSVCQRNGGIY